MLEIAKTLRIDEGRMPVGEWNGIFLKTDSVAEHTAGRDKLVTDGIIVMHECGSMFMWKNEQSDQRSTPAVGVPARRVKGK